MRLHCALLTFREYRVLVACRFVDLVQCCTKLLNFLREGARWNSPQSSPMNWVVANARFGGVVRGASGAHYLGLGLLLRGKVGSILLLEHLEIIMGGWSLFLVDVHTVLTMQ